jgi:5'-3' exonuclease
MGVVRLFYWVSTKYAYVIKKELKRRIYKKNLEQPIYIPYKVGGLYIDGNSLLHSAAQYVFGYGDTKEPQKDASFEMVGDRFLYLVEEALKILKPNRSLHIAVDGAGSLAKAQQQRTRRTLAASRPNNNPNFDSAFITPGTPFMDVVDRKIKIWLKENVEKLPKDTVYYSHRMAGEGEHKLIAAIVNSNHGRGGLKVKSGKLTDQHTDDHNVIYANDNDLILLAVFKTNNTLLIREKQGNTKEAKDLENPSDLGRFVLVDVDELRHALKRDYNITPPDFNLLCLFLGNDFVPTTPIGFAPENTLDTCLELYRNIKAAKPTSEAGRTNPIYVLYDDRIHWDDFYVLISALCKGTREQEMLYKRFANETNSIERSQRGYTFDGKKSKIIDKTIALFNNTHLIGNKHIVDVDSFRDQYWAEIYPGLSSQPEFPEVVLDVVDAYLESIVWSMTYYARGVENVNVEWYYRHYHAPTLVEVKEVMRAFKDIDKKRWEKDPLDLSGRFLNPLEIEIAILPLHILNKVLYGTDEINEELESKVFTPLRDLYPTLVDIDQQGRDLIEKSIVRLPFIDAKRIRTVAATLERSDVSKIEREPIAYPFSKLVIPKKKKKLIKV